MNKKLIVGIIVLIVIVIAAVALYPAGQARKYEGGSGGTVPTDVAVVAMDVKTNLLSLFVNTSAVIENTGALTTDSVVTIFNFGDGTIVSRGPVKLGVGQKTYPYSEHTYASSGTYVIIVNTTATGDTNPSNNQMSRTIQVTA